MHAIGDSAQVKKESPWLHLEGDGERVRSERMQGGGDGEMHDFEKVRVSVVDDVGIDLVDLFMVPNQSNRPGPGRTRREK